MVTRPSSPLEGVGQALERSWEATHEYSRYLIDTALLEAGHDIYAYSSGAIDATTDPRCKIHDPHVVAELVKLLDERYAELMDESADRPRGGSHGNAHVDKLGKVRGAWLEHYFRPRTEIVGPDEFNAWVATRAQYRGLSGDTVTELMGEPSAWPEAGITHYWGSKVLYDLTLPDGLGPVTLIVPPNVTVTGAEDNSYVYRWDKVDDPIPLSYSTYPSTRELLARMEQQEDALIRGLPGITLDDIELRMSGEDGVTN